VIAQLSENLLYVRIGTENDALVSEIPAETAVEMERGPRMNNDGNRAGTRGDSTKQGTDSPGKSIGGDSTGRKGAGQVIDADAAMAAAQALLQQNQPPSSQQSSSEKPQGQSSDGGVD
jgi:hypothetical protein